MRPPNGTVCLDVQGAQNPHHHDRGIARYVAEHLRALHGARAEMLHSVLMNPSLPLTGNLSWLLGSGLLRWNCDDRRVARRISSLPAVYHVMSPFEDRMRGKELWPAWARSSQVKTVVTLYDLIPLIFSDHYLRDPIAKARYTARSALVRAADHVLAISQATANDASEHLEIPPERITVIDAGASAKFANMYESKREAEAALGTRFHLIRPGFMLYVGGFEFRKNLKRLVEAYARLPHQTRASHQMVIACSMQPSEVELVRSWGDKEGVSEDQLIITGYVSDAELGALYHACALFVFPSFYEGSGLPILEAMSCGAPVIASNASTTPEIFGDLDGTFDPYDPGSISRCIADTIDSPAMLAELIERSRRRVAGYTWDAVAASTIEAYGIVTSRYKHAAVARPRVALVSPWPPERSGIADYNARLVDELSKSVDVDVVIDGEPARYATPLASGVKLVRSASYRAVSALRQYDRVIYCMGNSAYHRHVHELLREHPGVVVAHDVRLTGFYGWLSAQERAEDSHKRFAEWIEAQYGPRLPAAVRLGGWPGWETQQALGIYMTAEMQAHAEEVFVHSRYAREVLELDRGVLDRVVPVALLPFAIPDVEPRVWRPPGKPPVIVSVGVVSAVKGLALLISAASLIAQARGGVRLVIAGPGERQELEHWRRFAGEFGSDLDLRLTGHLPRADYDRLLADADLAVQLRMLSHGEASAAVADCLAAGLPTVVSDLGWASELSADVVAHVPSDVLSAGLAARIEGLLDDQEHLRSMSEHAQKFAAANSFSATAKQYLRSLKLV